MRVSRFPFLAYQELAVINWSGIGWPRILSRVVAMTPSDIVIPPSVQQNRKSFTAFQKSIDASFKAFNELKKLGVHLEDARYVLPNALTTNLTVTMNARELMHFFSLRLAPSAQWEIKELARKMLEEVKKAAPVMFERSE